jgi:CubicO group peptidase (beta-lactamase class C family)
MNTRRVLTLTLCVVLSVMFLTMSLTPALTAPTAAAVPLQGPVPASLQGPVPASLQGLDAYIDKIMADWHVPGLALAIVKDDQVVLSKGYGVIETGKPARVDDKTLFAVGSTTKAFTAAAVAMLVDQKKMGWDDPVTQYLKDFQMYDPWVTRHLTVRDTLTHRSGLDRADALWAVWNYPADELLRRVRFIEPSWEFRGKFGYQNLMYLAAGKMIEAASGQSWGDFLKQRIFTPLGMDSTNTSILALQGETDVATPHALVDGSPHAIPYRNVDNIAPAGAINSNAADMAQWVRMQLNGGKLGDSRLIGEKDLKETHSSQMVITQEPPWSLVYSYSGFLDYGMGWFLTEYNGHRIEDHGGNIDGMSALVSLMPGDGLGVVILTNMNNSFLPYPLALHIYDLLLDRPEHDWSADYLAGVTKFMQQMMAGQDAMRQAHVEGTKPTLALDAYTGTFENSLYGRIQVSQSDGALNLRLGPVQTPLTHWQYDTFVTGVVVPDSPPVPLTFALNMLGQVDSVSAPMIGEFKRVPAS